MKPWGLKLYKAVATIVFFGLMILTHQGRSESPMLAASDTSLMNAMLEKGLKLLPVSADSALYWYQKARDIAVKGVSESQGKSARKSWLRQVVMVESKIGLVYYQSSDYNQAVNHYEAAYKAAVELGHSSYIGDCLFNFGEVHLEQSQYQEAMDKYGEALREYEKVNDRNGIYWCYIGMGITQKQCGNFHDAEICYTNALDMAEKAGLKAEIAYCHNNLGNVYRKQGNFLKSMDAYEKALSKFREMDDVLASSDCMNNIGNLYLDSGDPFRALDYYNRSMSDPRVLSDRYRMIIRFTNMADAYKQLKDYTNALLFLDKAVKFAEETGDLTQLASGYMLMGELNVEKENPGIGISYLKKAAEMFHNSGARAEEANALVSLAGAELSISNIQDALKHAEEAEALARMTGALKTLYNASDCLSQIWEKAGDHRKSLDYMKRVLYFKDSLFSIEKNRAMEEIEAGFTRTRLENENQILAQNSELQEQALKTRNVAVIALTLCLFLALALTWLLYKRHVDTTTSSLHERELKESEIEKLSDNLSVKDRELTTKTLLINQKNGFLQKIIGELEILNHENGNDDDRIRQLQRQLRQELSPNAWKEFEIQFSEVHPGFHNRLLEKYPQLTPNERRLCAFLRLDMNTREISSLTGQSLKSIEVARTRIRSKMELPHDHNLVNFIALL